MAAESNSAPGLTIVNNFLVHDDKKLAPLTRNRTDPTAPKDELVRCKTVPCEPIQTPKGPNPNLPDRKIIEETNSSIVFVDEEKELTSMNQRQLKVEAKKLNTAKEIITEEMIEACDDEVDTKEALIKLILTSMNQKQLKDEARKMKLTSERIDACEEADDTKEALIELIQDKNHTLRYGP